MTKCNKSCPWYEGKKKGYICLNPDCMEIQMEEEEKPKKKEKQIIFHE